MKHMETVWKFCEREYCLSRTLCVCAFVVSLVCFQEPQYLFFFIFAIFLSHKTYHSPILAPAHFHIKHPPRDGNRNNFLSAIKCLKQVKLHSLHYYWMISDDSISVRLSSTTTSANGKTVKMRIPNSIYLLDASGCWYSKRTSRISPKISVSTQMVLETLWRDGFFKQNAKWIWTLPSPSLD